MFSGHTLVSSLYASIAGEDILICLASLHFPYLMLIYQEDGGPWNQVVITGHWQAVGSRCWQKQKITLLQMRQTHLLNQHIPRFTVAARNTHLFLSRRTALFNRKHF